MSFSPSPHESEAPSSEGEAATPSAVELAEALIFTAHTLKQFGKVCMEVSQLGPQLSMARAHLLAEVAEAGSVRMGDLSQILGVTPRNVTALVDAIERERLIERRGDPTDRRAILLALSAEGHALIDEINQVQQSISERMFAPLNAAERLQLYGLLQRVAGEVQRVNVGESSEDDWPDARRAPWRRSAKEISNAPSRFQAMHERHLAAHQARKEQAIAARNAHREQMLARRALNKRNQRRQQGDDESRGQ